MAGAVDGRLQPVPRTIREVPHMRTRNWSAWLVVLSITACAHQERKMVRIQAGEPVNLARVDLKSESIIIALRKGEVVPLEILVDGGFVSSAPGASIPLTVERDCVVRVDDRGIRLASDEQHLDEKPRSPGQFQIGAGVVKDGQPKATLHLATPVQ
jgi:hypothetical protein